MQEKRINTEEYVLFMKAEMLSTQKSAMPLSFSDFDFLPINRADSAGSRTQPFGHLLGQANVGVIVFHKHRLQFIYMIAYMLGSMLMHVKLGDCKVCKLSLLASSVIKFYTSCWYALDTSPSLMDQH